MQLRPYQAKSKVLSDDAFARLLQAIILCLPTGGGKTVIFSDITKDLIRAGYPVIIICNRKELIAQANAKLKKFGLNATLIIPGYTDRIANLYLASIDTLRNRTLPEVAAVIIDECHIRAFDKIVLEYKKRKYRGMPVKIYGFTATPSFSISFILDGATTSLATASRYVAGSLDPVDEIDIRLSEQGSTLIAAGTTQIAMGSTLVGIGNTSIAFGMTNLAYGMTNFALGTTAVAIGTSIASQGTTITVVVSGLGSVGSTIGGISTDPIDLYGYMKRAQEFWEGNAAFNKTSGAWSFYSRGNSTLLGTKTLSNSAAGITKT